MCLGQLIKGMFTFSKSDSKRILAVPFLIINKADRSSRNIDIYCFVYRTENCALLYSNRIYISIKA